MAGNSDFDKLLNEEEPQPEQVNAESFFADLPKEHREFVEKLIADYQFNQGVFEGIRNILTTLTANVTSCSLALWMIRWGASWYSAFITGLIIALVPGFCDVGKFLETVKSDKPMEIKRGIIGTVKIVGGSYATYQAVANWREVTDKGKDAINSVRTEIKDFEVKPQPITKWLDTVASIALSCAVISAVLWGIAHGKR